MSCPICGKAAAEKYRPFCSKRCADVDLGRWFSGTYAVPADLPEEIEEAADELARDAEAPARPH